MLRGICLVDIGGCTLNLCFLGYFILLVSLSYVDMEVRRFTIRGLQNLTGMDC